MEEENKNKDHKFLFWTLFIIISLSFISLLFYLNQNSSEIKELLPDILVSQKENATFIITDGANSGTIATNCATPTTILSVPTTYSASHNIIVAFVQAWSSDTGNEVINPNGIVLKSGTTNTMLVNNSITNLGVGVSGGATSFVHFITNHSAPANEIYNITACSSASAVETEAKMVILNNVTNYAVNYTNGSTTEVYNNASWLSTSYSGGNNVILSAIHIDGNSGLFTLVTANIKNSSGAILNSMSRPYIINGSLTTGSDSANIFLMAQETNAPTNAQYYIEINNTGGGYNYVTESVVFRVNSSYMNTSNTASLTTGLFNATTLANVNLSRNYTIFATGDIVDLDSSTESSAVFQFVSNSGTFNGTENAVVPQGVNVGVGSGINPAIMMERRTNDPTLNTFYLRTQLSATTWNFKGTMLAFSLEDEAVGSPPTDTCTYTSGNWEITCSDNCVINSNVVMDTNSNLSIIGEGNILFSANVTGFKNYLVSGISSSQKCNVIFANGARLR